MKQYNGKFSCQKCKQKGETLPNERVRVYPYEHINLRTEDETRQHAQQAFAAGFAEVIFLILSLLLNYEFTVLNIQMNDEKKNPISEYFSLKFFTAT